LRRADLAWVLSDVLSSLDLADQLGSVAAETLAGRLEVLADAVRVDQDGRAVGLADALAHVLEVAGQVAVGVADHRVVDLADLLGGLVPRLVHEVGVGGDTVNLDAHLLQLLVVVCDVAELGRADEGQVVVAWRRVGWGARSYLAGRRSLVNYM